MRAKKSEEIYECLEAAVCPVCQKVFVVPPMNVYKHRGTKEAVCSWTCCNKTEYKRRKKRKPMPLEKVCRRCKYLVKSYCWKKMKYEDATNTCNFWQYEGDEEEFKVKEGDVE